MIYGKWTECLWGIDPAAYESYKKRERRGDPLSKAQPVSAAPCTAPPRGGADPMGGPRLPAAGDECWESAVPLLPVCGAPAGEEEGLQSACQSETACLSGCYTGRSVCLHFECAEAAVVSWAGVSVPPCSPKQNPVHLCFFLGTLGSGCFFINLLSSCTLLA